MRTKEMSSVDDWVNVSQQIRADISAKVETASAQTLIHFAKELNSIRFSLGVEKRRIPVAFQFCPYQHAIEEEIEEIHKLYRIVYNKYYR